MPSVIDIFSICSLQKGITPNEGGVLCKYGGHFGFSTSDARFSLFLTLSLREVLLGVLSRICLVFANYRDCKMGCSKIFLRFFCRKSWWFANLAVLLHRNRDARVTC